MSYIGNTNTTQAFTPAVDYFSGNASTTAFTLSRPVASVAQVQVVVNNVAQNPSDAYTVSGSTITFTSAPSAGTNNIYVYYTSPITQVIAPGQGTVTTTSLDSAFILPVADGGTGVTSSTGSGSVVLSTSPTLTTPNIDSAQFATVSGTAPIYPCRAWVNFNGTGTVAIRGSGNVTSITDSGVGLYDVNFTTAMPDANYAPVVTAYSSNSALYAIGGQVNAQAPTTAKFRIATGAGASFGADTTAGYADLPHIFATVFR